MTKDHRRARHPRGTLPAFAPVPRQCERHDGWTAERQRGFIEALADTGSVRAAANSVNMAPEGAYMLRRHPQAKEFRKAWEAALALGVQKIEDVAMDRALNGVEVPVFAYGEQVGTRVAYNDALLMFMLRNRAPRRFAADGARGLSAVDQATLKRMRKQWRAEWDAERAALEGEEQDEQEMLDSLDTFLGEMRARRFANMPPRTRAAWEEYQRIEAEERAKPYWEQFPADDASDEPDDDATGPGRITDASGPAQGPDSAPGDTVAAPTDSAAPAPALPALPPPRREPRVISLKGEWD